MTLQSEIVSEKTSCTMTRMCPHTATAAEVYSRLSAAERRESPWVVVATAHPAKFNEIVEPIIGKPVTVPQSLDACSTCPAMPWIYRDARGPGRSARMTSIRIDPEWIWIGALLLLVALAGFWGLRVYQRRARRRSLLGAFGARRIRSGPPDSGSPTAWADSFTRSPGLLTPRGVLVLDTRRVAGLIFGGIR